MTYTYHRCKHMIIQRLIFFPTSPFSYFFNSLRIFNSAMVDDSCRRTEFTHRTLYFVFVRRFFFFISLGDFLNPSGGSFRDYGAFKRTLQLHLYWRIDDRVNYYTHNMRRFAQVNSCSV